VFADEVFEGLVGVIARLSAVPKDAVSCFGMLIVMQTGISSEERSEAVVKSEDPSPTVIPDVAIRGPAVSCTGKASA